MLQDAVDGPDDLGLVRALASLGERGAEPSAQTVLSAVEQALSVDAARTPLLTGFDDPDSAV